MVNYGRELRIRADIKRKESKKSDRVCRKNMRSSERDRSNIEKSIRKDEEASR